MPLNQTFIKTHSVFIYYAFVFAISWGSTLFFIGPDAFVGTNKVSFAGLSPLAVLAFLAGPSMAGLLMTGLVHGRAGLRDMWLRLFGRRVGFRWYATAALTAPFLTTAVLLSLSLISTAFLPELFTSPTKTTLLLSGMASALVVPVLEELGWTGFAIPELRRRHGVLKTGLIVGVIWGIWHYPLFVGVAASSTVITPAALLAVLLFSWLVAYRVLMVWIYDRTKSLLIIMMMHSVIVFGSLVLIPQSLSEPRVAVFDLLFAALLWVIVAGVAFANGGTINPRFKVASVAQ